MSEYEVGPVTVTVLMTVFNAGKYLPAAIKSVLEQTYQDWELLIMNDGSTDPLVWGALQETADLCDDRITIEYFAPSRDERRASCRYATLINWGIDRTLGDYITYLCGDDFYFPDRFERMVAKMSEPDVSVVYGSQEMRGETTGLRSTQGVLDNAFHRVDLNSVMHTREAFELAGGWDDDPGLWRDADGHFWNRLCDAGFRFHPVDGGPTDCKTYRATGVDQLVIAGKEPWA